MVKKLNPSFVEYFATYLKKLLSNKTAIITAEMFQEQVTNAANVYLNENYGADPSAARAAIAQSTPEAECAKAINARSFHKIQPEPDDRISYYKTQAGINTVTNLETLQDAIDKYNTVNPYNRRDLNVKWVSKTNMLLPDVTGRKRQQAVEFTPETAAYCGKCWICMTDVMSYSGFSNQWYDDDDNQVEAGTKGALRLGCKTPCGDCEHVSAIMASYIAGMLTSAGFAKVYWASYYVACVECNRRKSNYIGVKLSATGGWQVDDNGVNAIVDAIFPINGVDQHASEYNPIRNALTKKYNDMTPDKKIAFRGEVREYIESGTRTWCETANDNMDKTTASTRHIKMSFNVSKIIVAITGHLNVITGPLQKRANKAVKAGRPPVKPKLGKIRGGGPDDSDDDVEMEATQSTYTGVSQATQRTDTEGSQATGDSQATMVNGASSDDEDDTPESKIFKVMPVNPPILNWYNLIGEADVDIDYDDEDDKEDDKEDDDEFNARILKYRDVIVEYIGNTYSRILFNQYESDPGIFEMLMANLSNSMYETLKSTNPEIEPLDPGTLNALATKFAGTDANVAGLKLDEVPSTVFGTPSNSTAAIQVTPGSASVGDVSKKRDRDEKKVLSIAKFRNLDQDLVTDSDPERGGSRLNKRHSKHRTKRISYIKHKQTRKNHHSRKTNKNSNATCNYTFPIT